MSRSLVIHAVGDVAPRRDDPQSIFAGVAPGLGEADILFGQMECPLSNRGSPAPNAKLAMRTGPEVAPVLRAAGFSVMSVAGNHALDFGVEAFADTLQALESVGIATCGGGGNLAAARAPARVTAAGRTVAFLGYSSILPVGYAAEAHRPGCAPLRAHTHYEQIEPDQPGTAPRIRTFVDPADRAALLEDIRQARAGAEFVAVSLHWGLHFVRATIADYQRDVAHAAIDAGADMILGHHPHVLKAVEVYRGKPIFYSMGNFAIEQPSAFKADVHLDHAFADVSALGSQWDPKSRYMTPPETRHSLIARMTIDEGGEVETVISPCWINDESVPERLAAEDPRFGIVAAYLEDVTREAGLPTHFEIRGDAILIS